jgi:type II secretion system protein C
VPAADNRSVLWAGAASAALSQQSSPAAGFADSGGETAPFTIRGMIASLSGSSSVVFIQSSSGVSMIRQGEVTDGWKLTDVKGNTATFAREGRTVTLSLAKPQYEAGGGTATASAPSGPSSPLGRLRAGLIVTGPVQLPPIPQSPQGPSAAAASASVGSATAKGTEIVVPRSLVDAVRANPLAAMQGLSIQPYMPNGQMQGYTIANVASDSVAAPYLSPGDRILAVNGTPINSIGSAMNIYQQLIANNVSSATVTMERGGQRQNVVYTIK